MDLIPGGLGQASGLRPSDFIVSINDQAIATPTDLQDQLAALTPGSKAELKVKREQRFLNISLEGY